MSSIGVGGVQETPLERLRPWPENPRRIRPERLEDLKRALLADREMLWARPLVALADGTVIIGNQRLLGCKRAGLGDDPGAGSRISAGSSGGRTRRTSDRK